MVVAHIGSNLPIIFTSSTFVTEHNFHGLGPPVEEISISPSATIAALSKNLHPLKKYIDFDVGIWKGLFGWENPN